MPERKRTEAVTAREEPAAPQKTCMGCDSWDKFTCFNAASQFLVVRLTAGADITGRRP